MRSSTNGALPHLALELAHGEKSVRPLILWKQPTIRHPTEKTGAGGSQQLFVAALDPLIVDGGLLRRPSSGAA
jgi:hypothetical protein